MCAYTPIQKQRYILWNGKHNWIAHNDAQGEEAKHWFVESCLLNKLRYVTTWEGRGDPIKGEKQMKRRKWKRREKTSILASREKEERETSREQEKANSQKKRAEFNPGSWHSQCRPCRKKYAKPALDIICISGWLVFEFWYCVLSYRGLAGEAAAGNGSSVTVQREEASKFRCWTALESILS